MKIYAYRPKRTDHSYDESVVLFSKSERLKNRLVGDNPWVLDQKWVRRVFGIKLIAGEQKQYEIKAVR